MHSDWVQDKTHETSSFERMINSVRTLSCSYTVYHPLEGRGYVCFVLFLTQEITGNLFTKNLRVGGEDLAGAALDQDVRVPYLVLTGDGLVEPAEGERDAELPGQRPGVQFNRHLKLRVKLRKKFWKNMKTRALWDQMRG